MESKEQSKLTKYKHNHRYREQTDSCQSGGGLGVLGEKDEVRGKKGPRRHRQQYSFTRGNGGWGGRRGSREGKR